MFAHWTFESESSSHLESGFTKLKCWNLIRTSLQTIRLRGRNVSLVVHNVLCVRMYCRRWSSTQTNTSIIVIFIIITTCYNETTSTGQSVSSSGYQCLRFQRCSNFSHSPQPTLWSPGHGTTKRYSNVECEKHAGCSPGFLHLKFLWQRWSCLALSFLVSLGHPYVQV